MKGLLEIKEDWPPAAFNVSEKPEAVSIDTALCVSSFREIPGNMRSMTKQGQIVIQEHVQGCRHAGKLSRVAFGIHYRRAEKFTGPMRLSRCPQDESFYGFGERFTKLNKLGLPGERMAGKSVGGRHGRHAQADSLRHEHRGLRHFRQHDLSHALGHGKPFGGVLHAAGRRSATGLLHHSTVRASSKCWLAMRRSRAGRLSRPKSPSASGLPSMAARTGEAPMVLAKKFREMDLPMDYFTSLVSIQTINEQEELAIARQMSAELGKTRHQDWLARGSISPDAGRDRPGSQGIEDTCLPKRMARPTMSLSSSGRTRAQPTPPQERALAGRGGARRCMASTATTKQTASLAFFRTSPTQPQLNGGRTRWPAT